MTTSETQINETLNRISEQVEVIAGFVGHSAELQLATQHKLDHMTEMMKVQDEKWEQRLDKLSQRLDRMAERMDAQDEKWEQRLNLLTASSERQQASIDRMAASIESASIRQENVLAEYQKTAQALIQLATAMMQQKAG